MSGGCCPPHAELLGCGGTAARLARERRSVYIAILGEGLTSRSALRKGVARSALKNLKNCSRRIADLLGAKDLSLNGLPITGSTRCLYWT